MTDEPSIPPALTAEEWTPETDPDIYAGQVIQAGDVERRDDGTIILGHDLTITRPHATAALCLYGQPFGFTEEELEALYAYTTPFAGDPYQGMTDAQRAAAQDRLRHLLARVRDKVQALLPPK